MLHLFLDKKPWFRAKNHGYGTGLPIAWQGWVMLAAHMALIFGLTFLLRRHPVAMTLAVLIIALAPLPLYAGGTLVVVAAIVLVVRRKLVGSTR